jgi:hypothetical protein
MFTYKLLSGGLTRQIPTSSRFACKYVGLEVFVGLRKLHCNEAIRGISKEQKQIMTQKSFLTELLCFVGYITGV